MERHKVSVTEKHEDFEAPFRSENPTSLYHL